MKTKKLLKALGVVLAAVALVVVSVLGTMAWLTDTETVTNVVTVGNVTLTLTETTGTDYELIPGVAQAKNPVVTIKAGSAACYVRVKVTVDEAWGTAFPAAENVDDSVWTLVDANPTAVSGKLTYEYRLIEKVAATDVDIAKPFFTTITAPSAWGNTHLENSDVVIVAEAIQADGFADDPDLSAPEAKSAVEKAWAEFPA